MASSKLLFPEIVPSLSSSPGSPVNGMAYYDTTLAQYRVYTNGAWYSIDPNFSLTIFLPTPAVGTYSIIGYSNNNFTLTGVKNAIAGSGSISCSLTYNGSNITGFPSSITTTNGNATISQTVTPTDKVKLVISAISTPANVEFTLIGIKT